MREEQLPVRCGPVRPPHIEPWILKIACSLFSPVEKRSSRRLLLRRKKSYLSQIVYEFSHMPLTRPSFGGAQNRGWMHGCYGKRGVRRPNSLPMQTAHAEIFSEQRLR